MYIFLLFLFHISQCKHLLPKTQPLWIWLYYRRCMKPMTTTVILSLGYLWNHSENHFFPFFSGDPRGSVAKNILDQNLRALIKQVFLIQILGSHDWPSAILRRPHWICLQKETKQNLFSLKSCGVSRQIPVLFYVCDYEHSTVL